MLRRQFNVASATSVSSAFTATTQASTRTYFAPGAGEVGIWGATMKKALHALYPITFFVAPLFIYRVVYRRNCPDKQWITCSTDKWYSDGTEMKGEEATANLRLQRERIMPIMDAYLEKIEKATAESS